MTYLLASAATLGVLAGCSPHRGPVESSFFRESGALIDTGEFGTATMNNRAYMTGEKQWTYNMAQRFASEVLTTVNFAFNSSQLDAGAYDTLREQAAWIKRFPEVRFRVYGHTDKVGSDGYNQTLGQRRADAVVNFLVGQGISRSRLEAVVSYGEAQPLIVTEGRERRNRRTVTEVTGFVTGHPHLLDGNYAAVVYREYVTSGEPQTTQITGEQASSEDAQ
ncbi:OmpA family protein [Marinovum sp. 2_MG-2023]|uniref:OmpA family protein n=1 Tax=Marinovum sp. 2_MG-2023 TaxID=3062637 RepID=UPI0026E45666|nr:MULTISPECIES: OmpA family protein [unclassified Marinovum]MDO6731675.1 OmpA family protein [Marinovum sp. 2_MG-2023]MDO6780927.1 OmpA family protein [Marinovum sp. 1_MG-2023]